MASKITFFLTIFAGVELVIDAVCSLENYISGW